MTRRRRRGDPRCNTCGARVTFFRSPFTGLPRTFDPKPVAALTIDFTGGEFIRSFPVDGGRAWKYRELVEDLMVRRECSSTDAEDEVNDMPWYLVHHCRLPSPSPADDSVEELT